MSAIESLSSFGHIDTHSGFVPASANDNGNATWLSQFSLLQISGNDCEKFLQGQLTCDVSQLDQRWTLGACCTAKGRMVANFVIARMGDDCWLRLPAQQIQALLNHLKKYAVFFKVTLQIRDDYCVLAHWQDQSGDDVLDGKLTLNWPQRSETWLPLTEAQSWLGEHPLCSEQRWHAEDIQQGLVWVTAATQEHWIPQNIDWHQHGGVSFNKGCYTGQEIIARLQYLGKAKKALALLQADSSVDIDLLTDISDSSGKSVGEVASWRQQQGLGLINLTALNTGQLNIGGHTVSAQPIAYTQEQEA